MEYQRLLNQLLGAKDIPPVGVRPDKARKHRGDWTRSINVTRASRQQVAYATRARAPAPDPALILDYVPNSKSNDYTKSVSVISLFIRAAADLEPDEDGRITAALRAFRRTLNRRAT